MKLEFPSLAYPPSSPRAPVHTDTPLPLAPDSSMHARRGWESASANDNDSYPGSRAQIFLIQIRARKVLLRDVFEWPQRPSPTGPVNVAGRDGQPLWFQSPKSSPRAPPPQFYKLQPSPA